MSPAEPAPAEPAAVELDRLRRENRLLRIETEMLRRIAMEYALDRDSIQRIDQE